MATIDYKQKIIDYMNSSEVDTLYKSMLNNLFPELKESEDERIRKELLNAFQESEDSLYMVLTPEKRKSFIAYLEKQGVKHDGWNDKDEEIRQEFIGMIKEDWPGRTDVIDWLKSLKDRVQPKQEWSKEDEEKMVSIFLGIETFCPSIIYGNGKEELLNWFKDLKERYTWKPSDLPHWQKSTLPNDNTSGFNSDYFCHKGYYINYKELFEKLPKDD